MRIAPYPDVRVKDSDAERHPGSAVPGKTPARADGPLTDDQLAFYRQRIESGYYRSDAVRRHIAERLVEDVLPRRSD